MRKRYVKVLTEIDEEGIKTPKIITFDDRKFEVDKVLDIRNCASLKVGGVGERYTVNILGKTTYLFFERNKWFVEER